MKITKLLAIIILTCIMQIVHADFMPAYTGSLRHAGIGVLQVGNDTRFYESADENSKVVQRIYWNNIENFIVSNKEGSTDPKDIFLLYLPSKNIALFSVEDETDQWVKACYDQKNLKFGWVKKTQTAKFMPYSEFFFIYGKKYSVYPFRNLDKKARSLHSGPNDESMSIDGFEAVKFMTPWLVQGNWMLVKAVTYDNKVKTGWFKWRSSNGKLNAFIDFR